MFAATSNNAQSITAAPVNIVDIRISCPGQSTNEQCLYFKVNLLFSLLIILPH